MRKNLIALVVFLLPIVSFSQKQNWQNLDLKTDSVFGISTEKAYTELLKNKKSNTVVVAVIDGGVDTAHEDLAKVLWVNTKEIKGNARDDDKNGYVDDIKGWSFLGSASGNIEFENMEITRMMRDLHKAGDTAGIYLQIKKEYEEEMEKAQMSVQGINGFKFVLDGLLASIGSQNPSKEQLQSYRPQKRGEDRVIAILLQQMDEGTDVATFKKEQLEEGLKHFAEVISYHLNLDYDPRAIVGDHPSDARERNYGSPDIMGPDADHGTHVAGIIAAERDNTIGIKGVANNVRLMTLRAVPNGDERDKDVANAIRYAADNGARVINMSFGKGYSPDKKSVDEAVKYAVSKDVLFIHAAGNDTKDLEKENSFPTRVYADGSGTAGAWIEVGASGMKDDSTLAASFSNYGQTKVDVFAPGVAIYSTVPGSKYTSHDGTSMAAPVVTGLAALIREYYPKLNALQVKEIIMKSVAKVDHDVILSQEEETRKVPFSSLCISGGIVNAYNALLMAAGY